MDRRTLLASGAASVLAGAAGTAFSQERADERWPSKPVRLVVTFPPGGGSDALARILSKRLNEEFGQPVIVENKPGTGGAIGTAFGAKAAPDGYTFLIAAGGSLVVKPLLSPQSYDSLKDFIPITQLVTSPFALVVSADKLPGVRSVADLVRHAKQARNRLSFASGGNGTQMHLAGELFNLQSGANMVHVSYKGAGPAIMDLIGGNIEVGFVDLASVVPSITNNRIRVLAISSPNRSTIAPSVRSAAEEDIPKWQASGWIGLLAPARTPQAIAKRMEAQVNKILREKAVADQILVTGNEPAPSSIESFRRFMEEESVRWKHVVSTAGVKED